MLALVCLLGAAAATVDVGQALILASRAQQTADAAALAGAGGPIAGHSADVTERIQQTIEANNHGAPAATWDARELVTYSGGQTVPGYGAIGAQDEALTVRVRINSAYMFARALGFTSQVIERQATALRTASLSGSNCLMFALDSGSSTLGIDISGSRGVFDGTVHSNSKVDVSGSNHHFTGAIEWRNQLRITGSGTAVDQGDHETSVQGDPVGLTPEDFAPYDYEIAGNYNVSGSGAVPPGCYRVHGRVKVSGSHQTLANVTFVADGTISFSGSNHYYTPNRLGVFAYSLSTDSNSAVNISGSAPNSEGLFYAPYGGADFSGSDFQMVSIVAQTIDISGSDFHIAPCTKWGTRNYQVRLIS
jgi:Flp pilus assembly protein TadG